MMHQKKTQNYSQLNIEKLQFTCSKLCPKITPRNGRSMPAVRAMSTQHLVYQCPSLDPLVPVTRALRDQPMCLFLTTVVCVFHLIPG